VTTEPQLIIHGGRGSMAVSGIEYVKYGGNTTCFEIAQDPRHRLVIDAGTGLREIQHSLDHDLNHRFTMLLTHYHWDHIQGIPVFAPIWIPGNRFTFHGADTSVGDVEATLAGVITEPWFPAAIVDSPADISYADYTKPIEVGDVVITSMPLHHPQGIRGFRIQGPSRSIVIATDHESEPEADRALAEFAQGADVLIHDAQYLPAEYPMRIGWGHSTWEHAVAMARRADVGELVLTSHDPDHDDDDIDGIVEAAAEQFPNVAAGTEGMKIPL
jgi:phosphoribosyl 1,2-cyclic phosphodiesterase